MLAGLQNCPVIVEAERSWASGRDLRSKVVDSTKDCKRIYRGILISSIVNASDF